MEILELVEHSEVITNFVSTVHGQLKESGYRVYLNNVQYKWNIEGKKKIVVPDASICKLMIQCILDKKIV